MDVGELTVTPVAAAVPNFTAVTPVKLVPVMVTEVPPAAGPEARAHAGDGGGGGDDVGELVGRGSWPRSPRGRDRDVDRARAGRGGGGDRGGAVDGDAGGGGGAELHGRGTGEVGAGDGDRGPPAGRARAGDDRGDGGSRGVGVVVGAARWRSCRPRR